MSNTNLYGWLAAVAIIGFIASPWLSMLIR